MCVKVIINLGEMEIETPKEFKKHFGFSCDPENRVTKFQKDLCLCGWDSPKALEANNVQFKEDGDDIYVGKLEEYLDN